MQSVARCLQMMLRIDEYRSAFISVDGISTLLSVLSGRVNFQIQYQLIFCIWVLTFNPKLAERMNKLVNIKLIEIFKIHIFIDMIPLITYYNFIF